MTKVCHKRSAEAAFTLVELLTAVVVLSVLLIFVSVIFSAASKATQLSRERLDADRQARLIFDSMADDFTRMLRRPDVDFHFVSGSITAATPTNDTFFMFCENPGYFGTGSALNSTTESNMALIGYRVTNNNASMVPPADYPNTLEKLAKGLVWDVQSTTYPVMFLTFDNLPTDYTPDASTTIVGRWPNIDQPTYTDTNFHLLGDSTFRLKFCFLLTDGTYSIVPATNYTFTPPSGTTITSNLAATGPPSPSNGYPTYGPGSRWYDTKNYHGYVCTSAPATPAKSAVWQSLGMTDVQAVVVAIAILDQTSQKMISTKSSALPSIAAQLADPVTNPATGALTGSPPPLMATTWLAAVSSSTFASTVGLPPAAASQVRIYQRFFYLNNLYNSL